MTTLFLGSPLDELMTIFFKNEALFQKRSERKNEEDRPTTKIFLANGPQKSYADLVFFKTLVSSFLKWHAKVCERFVLWAKTLGLAKSWNDMLMKVYSSS